MSLGSRRWRVAAVGTAAVVVTTMVGLNTPASAATANPATYVFAAQGGDINLAGKAFTLPAPVSAPECSDGINNDIAADDPSFSQDTLIDFPNDPECTSALDNSEINPGYQAKGVLTLSAAISGAGVMSGFALSFPPAWVWTSKTSFNQHVVLEIRARLTPSTTSTGSFDAITGATDVNLKLELVFAPMLAGVDGHPTAAMTAVDKCFSDLDLHLSTTDAFPANPLDVTPVPYNASTGTATLADNNFAMPATSAAGSICGPTLYPTLGIPAAAGTSLMQFQMKTYPTANTAPTAVAGANQAANGGSTVTLNGSGTDPNVVPCAVLPCPTPGPKFFKWTQTAGTAVTLSNRFAAQPTFTAPNVNDTLTFKLEVADGRTTDTSAETQSYPVIGLAFPPVTQPASQKAYSATTSNTSVTTTKLNVAPTANAGPPQSVNEGAAVTLNGTGSSDPDGGPGALTYAWSQTAGPAVTLSSTTAASPTFSAPTLDCPGSKALTFSLTVNDGAASSTPSTVTITDNDVAPGGVTDGDYNGDGKADVSTFNPANGFWKIQCIGDVAWGAAGDVAVPGDYNGDGKTDIAVYVPNDANPTLTGREGAWLVKGLPGYRVGGLQGDIPIAGNYAGGNDYPWLYRPSTNGWLTPYQAPIVFGEPNAIPVPGDYNGDGKDDLAYYVEATGDWHIGNGTNVSSPTVIHFGGPGFLPAPGRYDAGPTTDLMTVKVSTGKWFSPTSSFFAVNFGTVGDIPATGDYTGTGIQQMGRYRTSCTCLVSNPLGNLTNTITYWGAPGFRPVNSPYAITRLFP